ncbi:hypothetical protein [Bacillus suaedaesalsae]|uniref:ABC transporter Uup C-terminal domain-containing protein n=1 Tax=Bacillus suaedaesalsae TaxID=2810349 RepID=A0ABS2DDV6_9BACI|nr:hypothetical protein [Bacillus suaedaesalsae]MBM6616623.1 hypothetical protein [Bacillus suaedaesalsae]
MNKIGERMIALEDYVLNSYEGNYDEFRKAKKQISPEPKIETARKAEVVKKGKDGSKKEAEKALNKIEKLENEIKELDSILSSSNLEYEEIHKLFSRKQELTKELDANLEIWMDLG